MKREGKKKRMRERIDSMMRWRKDEIGRQRMKMKGGHTRTRGDKVTRKNGVPEKVARRRRR